LYDIYRDGGIGTYTRPNGTSTAWKKDVPLSKPDTPTGVTATALSSSSVIVSWSSATGATGYKIYRSSSASGTYSIVGDVPATSYTDTRLNANTTYYYKVSAYNSAGESAQSSYALATTPTIQPRKFTAQNIATNAYYQLDAQLLYEGTYCNIWGELGNANATVAAAMSMGNAYDTNIYPKMTAYYGLTGLSFNSKTYDTMALADAMGDNDGKLCILLLDIKDSYNPSANNGYVGGYFWSGNMFAKSSYPNSNECDMIYVDTYPGVPGSASTNATVAHEMQHMMNFVAAYSIRGSVSLSISIPSLWVSDTWIDECLAESTRYVLDGTHDTSNTSRITWYNTDPYGWIRKGNTFFSWDSGDTVLDDYATAYLFSQWLRIQTGSTAIYKEITKSSYKDYRSVLNAFNASKNLSFTWDELLKTWFAANYIQDSSASSLYGYKNEISLTRWTVPASEGTSITLYPGEGVFSKSPASAPDASGNIMYAGINMGTKTLTSAFPADVLLTYNVNTSKTGKEETGTITGLANVEPSAVRLSVETTPSGPYVIGIEDMLRRNGFKGWRDEPPIIRRK